MKAYNEIVSMLIYADYHCVRSSKYSSRWFKKTDFGSKHWQDSYASKKTRLNVLVKKMMGGRISFGIGIGEDFIDSYTIQGELSAEECKVHLYKHNFTEKLDY